MYTHINRLIGCILATFLLFPTCTPKEKPPPARPEVTITVAERSPAPEGVTLTINEPTEGAVVEGPNITVTFTITNWEMNTAGKHIHFILDNEPYIPHYDAKAPFVFLNVSAGPHVIRAFPSREWHESVKLPEAFAMVQFYVGEAVGEPPIDPQRPMLVYSRPKGSYAGDAAKRILFDFWLVGVTLAPGEHMVHYSLDGEMRMLNTWKPVYFEGLTPGEHTLKIELAGPGHKPIAGNFNHTVRTFTVEPAEK